MQNAETLNPGQISEFLNCGQGIEFAGQSRAETYAWVQALLVAQEYACQGKKERGVIREYLGKVTGLSMAQTARLIQMYRKTGVVELKPHRRHEFAHKYTAADVALLAVVDRAHERLSGPATRCILRREYQQFGKPEYARLAEISVAHLYNLRNSARYRNQAAVLNHTKTRWEACRGDKTTIRERGGPCSSRHGRLQCRSASGGSRTRRGALVFCASTRFIKETGTEPKVFITSMPST